METNYEYDEARGTLALDMSDGTRVVWQVERQNAWQILLHRENAAGNRINQRLQRTLGSSPVLMRTVEILLTRRRRTYMEVIPVDLLRAWRISRIRSEQLETLYHDTEAVAADDEHSGLLAFVHAFKLYERTAAKHWTLRPLPMVSALDYYFFILDAWLYLYDRGIVVEGIEPLYVERYRHFCLVPADRLHTCENNE